MRSESQYRILNGFHAARVLVLGDVMLDRFVYSSGGVDLPGSSDPGGQRGAPYRYALGGAANVARNIAAMGARVILLGVVGKDMPADDLRFQLTFSPTIDARLVTDASRPTSVKTRYVADGQQVMRADRESRAAICPATESALLGEFSLALREAAVVILSDYAKGVLSEPVTRAVIDIARRAGKTIIVDPKSKDFSKYRGATIITPNRPELQQACGMECVSDDQVANGGAAHPRRDGVCEVVLVTRGKDGMSVIQADGSLHLPTAARQVYDVAAPAPATP